MPAIKPSIFCGASVDGFLCSPARRTRLLAIGEQEPHGFKEFLANVDVVVIGRRTFEVCAEARTPGTLRQQAGVCAEQPCACFSSVKSAIVEQMSGEPTEIVSPFRA